MATVCQPGGHRADTTPGLLQLDYDEAAAGLRGEPGALARQLLAGQVDRDEVGDGHRRDEDRGLGPALVNLTSEPARRVVAADIGDPLVTGVESQLSCEDAPLDERVVKV